MASAGGGGGGERPPLSAARVTATTPLAAGDAKWIRLTQKTYTDPTGKQRVWESAERQTRPTGVGVDGVGIVAILQDAGPEGAGSGGPRILLQKQFRPPVDKITIEVPAGLLDAGESIEACALRELREETGYIGELAADQPGDAGAAGAVSPLMYNDPGFCNTNVHMVHVSVDLRRPENRAPRPQLEDGEFIDCFTVPLAELYAECRRLEAEGYALDARVCTLAEGIEVAKRWKLH